MTYAVAPGTRCAYDIDGSIVVCEQPGYVAPYTLPTAAATGINGLKLGNINSGNNWTRDIRVGRITVVFPEPRNLRGLYVRHFWKYPEGGTFKVLTSADTTDGQGGTWTEQGTYLSGWLGVGVEADAGYRTVLPFTVDGIRAVRLDAAPSGPRTDNDPTSINMLLHVYADTPAASSGDRLQPWHPTLDQPIAAGDLDVGSVSRGSTVDRTFRVKNTSATLTATGVSLAPEVLHDSTPPAADMLTLSADGVAFSSPLALPDLAPGALTSVLTARLAVSPTSTIEPHAPRLVPTVTAWT